MYSNYISRTDLAIEEKEKYTENNVEIQGIEIYEDLHKDESLKITEVRINDKKAAIKLVRIYLDRWRIETYHRSIKTEYNYEDIRVRRLNLSAVMM